MKLYIDPDMESKYMIAIPVHDDKSWTIYNKKHETALAMIRDGDLMLNRDCIFSSGCLVDIFNFMRKKKYLRKYNRDEFRFVETTSKKDAKTKTWVLMVNGSDSGILKWYFPWRQYCYFPNGFLTHDAIEVHEIFDFIIKQKEARK
jgi:hypothetical protein